MPLKNIQLCHIDPVDRANDVFDVTANSDDGKQLAVFRCSSESSALKLRSAIRDHADELRRAADYRERRAPATKASATPGRTDQQIVDETEKLAASLMLWAHNREFAPGCSTLYRLSTDPRAASCWAMACKIQEELTNTDVHNAVAEVDDAPPVDVGTWNLWACAQDSGRDYWVASGSGPEMRLRLANEAAHSRDVWLIAPDGTKHLPQ